MIQSECPLVSFASFELFEHVLQARSVDHIGILLHLWSMV